MLRVSRQPDGQPEIFHSIQGEGVNIGAPTVFLRLANCNLCCSWCDTKYTWDWQHYDYRQETISLKTEEVAQRIEQFRCPHLVITGGEPLLQQIELGPLVASLKDKGFYSEVETNGTLVPLLELVRHVDQWNVSPKLANSENLPARRESPAALEFFRESPNAYFKFVIVELSDVDEVSSLRYKYRLPAQRIILMPEGRDTATLQRRSVWLAEACAKNGFRFSTRLHILLWGDERGR